jgi:hypothetical protein
MTGQLDSTRYEELVKYLLDLKQPEPLLDPLNESFAAITAVLHFLNADARLVQNEATKPLGRLQLALLDRLQGAKPKLLFDKPNRMGAEGAPSHTSSALLRARVNAAYLSLCESGMSQQEASGWVAAELKRCGIKQPNGRTVDPRTIARWRAEMGGKSPKGSDEAFATHVLGAQSSLRQMYPEPQSDDKRLTPRQAKAAAAVFIKTLRIAGF